jgi:TonB family protein
VASGTLRVESQPPGATVMVDGQSRGVTPLEVPGLALGSHEVKVELKGFTPAIQKVELTSQPVDVKLALVRIPPATGVVEIISSPPGAAVSIDGARAGATPLADLKLKPGTHRVEVTSDGYEPWSTNVSVQPGRSARVEAVLRQVPKATPPPPDPNAFDPNRIYANVASEVDVLAKKLSGSASYPSDKAPRLKSGESVSVSVTYVVTENGEVTDLKVIESAGQVVDEAVTGAIKRWKYSPAMKRGVKVKVRVAFKQTFRAG